MWKHLLAGPGALRFNTAVLVLMAVAALLAAACGDDDGEEEAARTPADTGGADIGTLTLHATDHAFRAEGDMRPGPTRVVMPNEGAYDHYALIFKVEGDHGVEDVMGLLELFFDEEAMAAATEAPEWPDWALWKGGPSVLSPGETAELIIDFEPGRYVIVCPMEEPGGVMHYDRGMVAVIDLEGEPHSGPMPTADLVISGEDDAMGSSYWFGKVPETLDAGERLVEFRNDGSELHEFVLLRLGDGMTLDEAFEAELEGSVWLGGPAPFGPGDRQLMHVDLEPGTYVLLCFWENDEAIPHADLGMLSEIAVQ